MGQWLLAVVVGLLQGVFEWLPISSEGNITLYLTLVEGLSPDAAVRFSLFLHAGTAVAATVYYRDELRALLADLPGWRPDAAFADADAAELTFLGVATAVSVVVGLGTYAVLDDLVSALTGGAVVALVGALLVLTGLLQRWAASALSVHRDPTLADAVLAGAAQGVAVLPGVSRSGTTTGALLLRGHAPEPAFRRSFLLSIPAALGAGVLVVLDSGLPALDPATAGLALATSALVGYLTIDALMRVVRRVAFWGVCLGLGLLALVGGLLTVLL